jgi:PAS domain S-box-containing protein
MGRVTDANAEYIRLSGHTDLAEITGRSVLEWTAPYEKEKNAAAIRECLEKGFIRNFEIDYRNAAGVITPVEINATVVNPGGSFQIVTLCRDITNRRNAEKALRESEQEYRSIMENMQDMFYRTDLQGRIVATELVGVTRRWFEERGVAPKMFHGQAEVDRLNAESYAEQRDRPLDRVLSDFHAVHAQLLKRLEAVRERDLTDPQRFKWMEGEPLEKLAADNTFGHYAEHLPAIETWRSKISN